MILTYEVTPPNIQYSTAKRFGGVTDWHLEPRFIENQRSCLRHHLQSPTLPSTPILNREGYFGEPTSNYQMEVLRELSCTDTMDSLGCQAYIPLEDEHVLLAEEQPLPHVFSPTAESPEYVAKMDPEEDSMEMTLTMRMDEEDEEEEHLAPDDSAVVIPTDELVSSPEGTEHVMPPPSTDTATTGARITVRLQAAISFPPEEEVERLLSMPTPSPSPLTSLSPPFAGERLARCTAPATLPPSPLPPPLHMSPPVDRRDDIPETEMPPHKRLCLSTLGSRYEVRESSTVRPTEGRGIDYGFISTLDAEARRRGIGEVGYGIRDTDVVF
nr:hypothetical protein [Tanacetum cinerariifolium]